MIACEPTYAPSKCGLDPLRSKPGAMELTRRGPKTVGVDTGYISAAQSAIYKFLRKCGSNQATEQREAQERAACFGLDLIQLQHQKAYWQADHGGKDKKRGVGFEGNHHRQYTLSDGEIPAPS